MAEQNGPSISPEVFVIFHFFAKFRCLLVLYHILFSARDSSDSGGSRIPFNPPLTISSRTFLSPSQILLSILKCRTRGLEAWIIKSLEAYRRGKHLHSNIRIAAIVKFIYLNIPRYRETFRLHYCLFHYRFSGFFEQVYRTTESHVSASDRSMKPV
jgi:hypothetical protein